MRRFAKCCEESPIMESSKSLAFYEFRGEGSKDAINLCICGYHRVAHVPDLTHSCTKNCGHCNNFQPHGPYEYDRYYCGHMGWD
jgi:hypothetical protein